VEWLDKFRVSAQLLKLPLMHKNESTTYAKQRLTPNSEFLWGRILGISASSTRNEYMILTSRKHDHHCCRKGAEARSVM